MENFNNIRTKNEWKLKKGSPGEDPSRQEFIKHMAEYDAMYLFTFEEFNKRNLKEISSRKEWSDSEMWYSINVFFRRTFQHLLANKSEWPGLYKLYTLMRGSVAFIFTNRPQREVKDWFRTFSHWDYPREGYEVSITVTLEAGPLPQFSPKIEPYLRQLGMPTTVVNGKVILTNKFEVCRAGNILTSEQVNLLELLGEKLSVFKLKLKGVWTKERGYEKLETDDASDSDGEDVR